MRILSCLSVVLFFFASSALAAGEVVPSFTLDGRLYADSAATTPLTDPDIRIVVQILNQAQDCILYEETVSHFDGSVGNGYFTLHIGSIVGSAKRSALDSAHPMATVYSNTAASISGRTFGGAACAYSPNPGDQRFVRMQVTPSSDGTVRTLSPNMALDSVPMATIAESAESIQGYTAANLLKVNNSGSQVLTQSNLENVFSSSNYNALTALLNGSSTVFSKPATNGTTPLADISSPATPAAGQIWYDGGSIKYSDGSSTKTLSTTTGSVTTSIVAGTGLNVGSGSGGTITDGTGTLNIDVGTTAGKIVQVAGGDKLPAIDGSNLTALNGSAISSGTIGGSTAINSTGNIATTGNVAGANGSFAAISSGQISLYDSATTNTNYITLKTPATATLTSDYTLTLPPSPPASTGQVLTADTSGQLSWAPASSGSVTSVTTGGAPIVIGGTAAAPTVSVTAATTAATGVVQLAVSGGTTAGTAVQATDSRLSDSRPPNGAASGDLSGTYPAPTVAAINGKAVTYASLATGDFLKYDGSGWVNTSLSTANLSDSSSLLKSSQMPSNCSAGSTLTFSSPTGTWLCTAIVVSGANFAAQSANTFLAGPTTGSAAPAFRALTAADLPASASYWSAATGGINYAGGKVGIGTTTPSQALDVNGNVFISKISASSSDPALISFSSSSFFNRIDLNGGYSGFQAGNGKRDTIAGYWGLEVQGNRQTTFPTTFSTGTATDPSLTVIGGQAGAPVVEMKGVSGQTGDMLQLTSNGGSAGDLLKVTSAGNVGIGTTPTRLLDVNGAIRLAPSATPSSPAAGDVYVDSTDSNKFKWYDGGSWQSVGSATDNTKVAKTGDTMTGNLYAAKGAQTDINTSIEHSSGASYSGTVSAFNSGGDTMAPFHAAVYGSNSNKIFGVIGLRRTNSSWGTTVGAIPSGTYLPGIGFAGQTNSTSGSGMVLSAGINAIVNGSVSSGVLPTDLIFQTSATDSSGLGERMRVTSAGNVGVGTASPAAKLDVAGEVKFGNTASTCNGTNEGQQRYNSTSHVMEFCNGTSWTAYGTGGGGGSAGITACPSGWTMIGDSGKVATYCIETVERSALGYFAAKDACSNINDSTLGRAHLCTHNEWHTACVRGTGLTNMTNNWEWVADLVDYSSGLLAGTGSCTATNTYAINVTSTYRCCIH